MSVYRLVLSYDGADFHGWQKQPEQRTVQGEVERALAVPCRREVMVQGAGRTDSGVHALGQCASFRLAGRIDARKLLASLRGLLPDDITALDLHETGEDFNARFSATGRFYIYRLGLRDIAPLRRLRWTPPWKLDSEAMRAAMASLAGAEDFRAFCTAEAALKGTVCHIRRLDLEEKGDELQIRIGADRFLHNMVRIITGTLIEVGRGRWRSDRIDEILASGDRAEAGPTAPPHGLYLERIEYPGDFLRGSRAGLD